MLQTLTEKTPMSNKMPAFTGLQLTPEGFTTPRFEENKAFFQLNSPYLYDRICRHKAKKFHLAKNPDGSENIINLKTGNPLYPDNREALEQFHHNLLQRVEFTNRTTIRSIGVEIEDSEWNLVNPMILGFNRQMYAIGPFKDQIAGREEDATAPLQPSFLPILRVYGIGLGNHILMLLQKFDIACLIINEVEFDLFYCSLFITPWASIFEYFSEDPHREILLNLESDADIAIKDERVFLNKLHPFFFRNSARVARSSQAQYQTLIDHEFKLDSTRYAVKTSGWYEDQIIGLRESMRNLLAQNAFYNGRKIEGFLRVFLVGAGPSLDESIDYIKRNRDQALVVACGSAITPLLRNAIKPDIHLLQERNWDRKSALRFAEPAEYSDIQLFKLNVIPQDVDPLYRNVCVFQKSMDPGSTILDPAKYPHSYFANPTVANFGLSLCASLGADEVFLFGIDFGAPVGAEFMHATDSYHRDADQQLQDKANQLSRYKLKGNFSEVVVSDRTLAWSHSTAEFQIDQYRDTKWINVGDGAEIKGARKAQLKELPRRFPRKFDKASIERELPGLFDANYSLDACVDTLQNTHVQASFAYLNAILDGFDSLPRDRCALVSMLNTIYLAASTGSEVDNYLPQKLFSFEIIRYLELVYVQLPYLQSDQQAMAFFAKSIEILKAHLEEIFCHFQNTLIDELQVTGAMTDQPDQ